MIFFTNFTVKQIHRAPHVAMLQMEPYILLNLVNVSVVFLQGIKDLLGTECSLSATVFFDPVFFDSIIDQK